MLHAEFSCARPYLELVMYTSQQLINAVKSLADVDGSGSGFSYCQLLDFHAQSLNFQNFRHYRQWVKSAPETSLLNLSTRLRERVCATKLPTLDEPYVEFTPLPTGIGYYSYWIGWDKHGEEVRIPRPLDAQHSVPRLRKLKLHPVYVVESPEELISWQYRWKAPAYIPEKLAQEFYPCCFEKRHLVDPNVPTEVVKRRVQERASQQGNFVEA